MPGMKLQQGQVWKRDGEYLRITRLERLEVEYKSMINPTTREGTHHHVSKKAFCRLIKSASLFEIPKTAATPPASSVPPSPPLPDVAPPAPTEN